MRKENVGQWAFIIGVIVALLAGLFAKDNTTVGIVLVVLGLVVGLINITEKETLPYLVASVALIIAGNSMVGILGVGEGKLDIPGHEAIAGMLKFLVVFTVPAAIVGALRGIYALASRA